MNSVVKATQPWRKVMCECSEMIEKMKKHTCWSFAFPCGLKAQERLQQLLSL